MELERLRGIIAEVLHVDEREVEKETRFFDDLGADSLDIFQIVTKAEDVFEITLTAQDCAGMKTVGRLIEIIQYKRG